MNRRIRAASLCAALAAAVLVGGTAQAYAAAASPAPAHAAATPAVQEGTSTQAIEIWHYAGRYDSFVAAQAAYWVLYGLGSAIKDKIEQVVVDGAYRWDLYIQ
ncbi:hypothetical protein ACFVUY_40755 [Kitasatospora sp. NPDC058063]|uniref:hypothetical protein n=1 Tax=unclassified Kitasatospora TaxID=2633591 RepID=UPI0036DE05A3